MFFNFLSGGEEEQKEEQIPKSVTPSCYGCVHMVASPMLDCVHPNSVRVLWDAIRNRSYRLPSVPLCRERGGICKYYDPSPERGVEYTIIQRQQEGKKKQTVGMDQIISNLIDDGEVDKFLGMLNKRLLEDEEEEKS